MSDPQPPPGGSEYPGWHGQQQPQSYPTATSGSNLPPGGMPPQPPYGYPVYPGYPYYPAYPGYYSHRTKAAAGLLQLLPGFFLGLGGIGRCYTGHVAAGVIHLVLSVLGWILSPFFIGIPIVIGCWLWAVIDGIVLLAGRPTDSDHRLLS